MWSILMNLNELRSDYSKKRDAFQRRYGERQGLEKRERELTQEIDALRVDAATNEKAVWLLQQYADFQQREVIEKIEDIVTSGLQAVFRNNTLSFKLYYSETKSGTQKKAPEITMAVFYDYGGNQVRGDIKNSFGGGLSVVVSTLLRVVIVWFLKEKVQPILLLDEPLRDLSPSYDSGTLADGYRLRMAEFLAKLTLDAGIQIILVAHEPEYGSISDIDHRFDGSIGKTSKVTTSKRLEVEGIDLGE